MVTLGLICPCKHMLMGTCMTEKRRKNFGQYIPVKVVLPGKVPFLPFQDTNTLCN
jgi:hypothetical protein